MECPRCFGSGEERVAGDGLTVPDEYWPCALCLGTDNVPDEVAVLYEMGLVQWNTCDECGEYRLCSDDGFMVLCSACWPVGVEAKEAAE